MRTRGAPAALEETKRASRLKKRTPLSPLRREQQQAPRLPDAGRSQPQGNPAGEAENHQAATGLKRTTDMVADTVVVDLSATDGHKVSAASTPSRRKRRREMTQHLPNWNKGPGLKKPPPILMNEVVDLVSDESVVEQDVVVLDTDDMDDTKPAAVPTPENRPMVVQDDPTLGVTRLHRERKGWSYDFMSALSPNKKMNDGEEDAENAAKLDGSSSFRPTEQYLKEAENQLFCEFPFLSHVGVSRILRNTKANGGRLHYAIAHHVILQAIQTGKEDKSKTRGRKQAVEEADSLSIEYRLVQRALAGHELNDRQKRNLKKLATGTRQMLVEHPRKPSRHSSFSVKSSVVHSEEDLDTKPSADSPMVTQKILLEEMEYVRQKVQDWMEMGRNHIQRKRNQQMAQFTNTGVECLCCFDSFLIEDMCACRDEGHLFCVDCLKSFADSQIFGLGHLGAADKETQRPAMDLKCFYADCKSGFSRDILGKALSRQALEKYDELQCQIAVQAAGLINLVTCPKCSFKVQMDTDANAEPKFACPMDDCKHESCRLCLCPWHGKELTCDDALQKAKAQNGRHGVEEAMTSAKIRSCSTCQKRFLKESGCNKIKCTGCQTLICYVCQKVISVEQYAHFCQVPHCTHEKCGKCRLWTRNDEEEDRKAMRQAGLEAAAAMNEKASVVDQLLKNRPQTTTKK